MITRAQAEALLTLAESLETCERVGVDLEACHDHVEVRLGPTVRDIGTLVTGASVRTAVADLMTKHTGS